MSSMEDIIQFIKYNLIINIWCTLKDRFEGISSANFISYTIKLNTYKKSSNHDMRKYLKFMCNMVNELEKLVIF